MADTMDRNQMTGIEIDTLSRNRIVSEMDQNFFVEAGAGSGKTTMLVSRMVAMVEAGIDISRICAITFTKAAAGEFYDRFQKMLIERSNPDYVWVDKGYAGQLPAPTDETRHRCERALQNIDLCFMGTIDSFCSMVLSEHPSEAGIPSDAAIITDEEAKALYQQIYVNICAGDYGESLKKMAETFQMFFWNAEKVFVAGESFFMDHRNVQFHFEQTEVTDIDATYAEERKDINQALKCLMAHPELAYDKNQDSRDAWADISNIAKQFTGRWSTHFSNVVKGLKQLKNLRVVKGAEEQYPLELGDCLVPGGKKGQWLEFAAIQAKGLYDQLMNLCYKASMTFLTACIPTIEQEMREKGSMTFFDYLYYLRNMLKKDAAGDGRLINYIYKRHSYFLIDEFQDTNPIQAEVFFYLAAEHPVEQWSACVPRPGSLFIVGDPKQSIYRFRSADVTSFLHVKKLFQDSVGEILSLSRNFRSTYPLIGYFNRVFGRMLPEETEIQSKFAEIPLPKERNGEFQGIYRYEALTGELADDLPEDSDPSQICRIIDSLVGKDQYQISVNGCSPRPIRYSDIMVITYRKPKIDAIMEMLEAHRIPMKVEGKVPFERNKALEQILRLYRAVAAPDDQKALYDALEGRFYGSCPEEMMKFRLNDGQLALNKPISLPEDADPTARKVAGYIEDIRKLSQKAAKLSPAALFAEIMDHREVYKIAPVDNMEVLYYTLEMLREAERTGEVTSLRDGANYINKLFAGKSDLERCLSLNDNQDCVHIANLHKVKGLEAPVVILAAAIPFSESVSEHIVHGDNGSEGYVFAIGSKTERGIPFHYFETSEYAAEKEAENEAVKAEKDRLVYVAATRARNALFICDSVKSNGNHSSAWKPLLEACGTLFFEQQNVAADYQAYLDGDDENLEDEDEWNPVDEAETPAMKYGAETKEAVLNLGLETADLYRKAEAECVLNGRDSEKATYRVENPSHVRISSKMAEEQADVLTPVEAVAADREDSPIAGTGSVNASDQAVHPAASITVHKDRSDVHRFPALLGTMTHRLMEVMVSSKCSCAVDQVIDEILRAYRTPQNLPYEVQLASALKTVAETMQHGGYAQENAAPQDILQVLLGADEVYCEVPFCYREEVDGQAIVWNGIMDVIYCEAGKWHIIDYKTNMEGDHLDQKYRAQLTAYRKALKATAGYEADAYTYHIDI